MATFCVLTLCASGAADFFLSDGNRILPSLQGAAGIGASNLFFLFFFQFFLQPWLISLHAYAS